MIADTFMGSACKTGPHNGTGCIRYNSSGTCVEAVRAYCAAHKDVKAKHNANYYATHKDKIANYYATNKDKIAKYNATHKDVKAKHNANYYATNKDKIAKYDADYYATIEGRAKSLLKNARNRAKKKNLDFNLTLEWVLEQLETGVSPLSGMKFSYEVSLDCCKRNPFAPSIDKIDSKKGYTPDNCRIITTYENMAISEYGFEFTVAYWQAVFKDKDGIG